MKVVVFGTGSALTDFLTTLPDQHEVVALCDNNAEKWGTTVAGRPVVSPAHLQTTDADLIVIGSRGLTGVQRVIEDSVSSLVVAEATCSVLVVKA